MLRPQGSEEPCVFAAGVTGAQRPRGWHGERGAWESEGMMMEGPLGLVGTSDVVLNVTEAGDSCEVGFLCKTSLWARKEAKSKQGDLGGAGGLDQGEEGGLPPVPCFGE